MYQIILSMLFFRGEGTREKNFILLYNSFHVFHLYGKLLKLSDSIQMYSF